MNDMYLELLQEATTQAKREVLSELLIELKEKLPNFTIEQLVEVQDIVSNKYKTIK